jgi:hypothetical protein
VPLRQTVSPHFGIDADIASHFKPKTSALKFGKNPLASAMTV